MAAWPSPSRPPKRSRRCASPAAWPPRCSQVVAPHVKPGVTTEELDRICHDHIVNVQQAIPANVGYQGFPKTVCTSVNNVICHGIPSEAKVLKDGDIVNIDVTVIKDGWHGDTSRMYVRRHAVGDGQAPGGRHPRGDVPRHPHRQAGRDPGRHRRGDPAVRRGRALQRGARVLRPRHRPDLPRRPAGAALRPRRRRPGAEAGHDLHDRADDQRGRTPYQAAARWLDRGHQGPQALGAVGTHRGGDRRRRRDPDPPARATTTIYDRPRCRRDRDGGA